LCREHGRANLHDLAATRIYFGQFWNLVQDLEILNKNAIALN